MENLLQNLSVSRLTVRFFAQERVSMKFWIGAVLRNRFLYAADQVLDEQGLSLRRHIDTLPLPQDHFLYKQLQGGFPKGFLFDCSTLPYEAPGFTLEENWIYTFSLVLIGNMVVHKQLFIEALRVMLQAGFGHPIVPLTLVDIVETPPQSCPIVPCESSDAVTTLELLLKTPVCLFPVSKKEGNGFQSKMNGIPSFCQFMRSLAYRLVTLSILYTSNWGPLDKEQMDRQIDQYLQSSEQALLLRADLRWEKRRNTPKKGANVAYIMGGYTGRLVFGQVPTHYLPLLAFAEALGVGADISYGLGSFLIRKIERRRNRPDRSS